MRDFIILTDSTSDLCKELRDKHNIDYVAMNITYDEKEFRFLDDVQYLMPQESKEKIEELQKNFSHSIDRDMDLFKDEIKTFLSEQFIQRYHFSEGLVEYRIKYDEEIAKAVEILSQEQEYLRILNTNQ